jgi:hypothetical protein
MSVDPNESRKRKSEKNLTKTISKVLSLQKKRIIQVVSDNKVDELFWKNEDELFYSSVFVELKKIADEAVEVEQLNNLVVSELADAHKKTLEWAKDYSFELVKGINATSKKVIEEALKDYFSTPGYTLQEFIDIISPTFGPVRAEMIAVTETTRAYSAGSEIGINSIRELGIEVIDIWNTNEDELVCPICGPLDGKERGNDWNENPPAHPRCRCWITHKIKDNKRALNFYISEQIKNYFEKQHETNKD